MMLPPVPLLAFGHLIDKFTSWLGNTLWKGVDGFGQLAQWLAQVDRVFLIPIGLVSAGAIGVPFLLSLKWLRSAAGIRGDVRRAKSKLAEARMNLVIADRHGGMGLLTATLRRATP